MSVTSVKQKQGWTLLELLIVIGVVSALAAILLYSFVNPVNQQVEVNNVSSHISELRDAAHQWRHPRKNYLGISFDTLKRNGLIPNYWKDEKMEQNYQIESFDGDHWSQCRDLGACVKITVFNINNPCSYIMNLSDSDLVSSVPSIDECRTLKHKLKNHNFSVLYE